MGHMWRIIDNYSEEILPFKFETKEEANWCLRVIIYTLQIRHINYDFDVEELSENIKTYEDYRREFYDFDEL